MKTVGIVLAGGLSRRFGSPKAFAEIDQDYFYERAVNALQPHCEEVIIVTRRELMDSYPANLKTILDLPEFAGCGPLAGILSVMEFVEADCYAVLPCDMPYVDEYIIGQLVKLYGQDVTAVVVNGRHHPLVSIWSGEVKSTLHKALANKQLSVMRLLKKLDVLWIAGNELVENEENVFKNMNTPIDLEGD